MPDDLGVGVLVLCEHGKLLLESQHRMLERVLSLLRIGHLRLGADPAVVQGDGETASTQRPLQPVDRDELLDPEMLLLDAALETGHLLHVFMQTFLLDTALVAHVLQEIVFIDPTDDRGGGRHRTDHRGQHYRENGDGNHDAAAIEEEIPHAATDVARNDLDLDHGPTRWTTAGPPL